MGCASSTEASTNYVTGEKKTKHKMGGAYPGNRRQANKPYAPPASQFSNGQATSHFVSYGGGNALVLKQGGIAQPQIGATAAKPQFIQVTLPAGVSSGQTIQVQAPDGRLNEIIIPPGFGPGSTFTVEFADADLDVPPTTTTASKQSYMSPATAAAPQRPGNDDGFSNGFNNPGFVAQATPATNVGANDYSSYPTATDAQPIYAETAQPTYTPYVSKPY